MRDGLGFDARKPSQEIASLVRFAGLVLSLDACMLTRESGDAIQLTRGEFALLRTFIGRPGRVISRDTLLDAFTNRRFEPFDRSIDVLVGKLRRKIEADPKRPRLIVTVPGEGYRFDGLSPKPSITVGVRTTIARRPRTILRLRSGPSVRGGGWGEDADSDHPEPPRLSIVVLPFANIGGDPSRSISSMA